LHLSLRKEKKKKEIATYGCRLKKHDKRCVTTKNNKRPESGNRAQLTKRQEISATIQGMMICETHDGCLEKVVHWQQFLLMSYLLQALPES
jgi:hypothetical protein